MNFEHLYDLVGQYQYDEIRIVGKDVTLLGKMAHIAAVMRRNDQIELCLLMQEEPTIKEPKIKIIIWMIILRKKQQTARGRAILIGN